MEKQNEQLNAKISDIFAELQQHEPLPQNAIILHEMVKGIIERLDREDKPDLVGAYIEPEQATEEQFKENLKKLEPEGKPEFISAIQHIDERLIHPDWNKYLGLQVTTPGYIPSNQNNAINSIDSIDSTLKEILKQLKTK